MKKNKLIKPIFFILIPFLIFITSCTLFNKPATNIRLPVLFSDNMVIQMDKRIPVWGTADPGGTIIIEIAGQRRTIKATKNGNWQTDFQPLSAGGPYKLSVIGQNTIICENVMVGEVWICSGQSNMEMPVFHEWGKVNNAEQEIAAANYPNIRLFRVNRTWSTVPVDTINSSGWEECSPNTISEFSATAYFFGRSLYRNLNIPVGLIHTSWGGTVAEAWTSAEALKTLPDFVDQVQSIKADTLNIDEAMKLYEATMKSRRKKIIENDAGYLEEKYIWKNPELKLSGWENMKLPVLWEKAGHENLDGVVWFRKTVNIPASTSGKELMLQLGPINDNDITWFNGVKVGSLDGANKLRKYKIPGSIVKTGMNLIAVRVFDIGNNGGIYGNPEQLKIEDNSGNEISLSGTWKYKIGFNLEALPPRPQSPDNPNKPTLLYNAMIHPLIPYAMRGAIWYQGEANTGRAFQYKTLFPAMINDWRSHWTQGDFPFLFVQLANFMETESEPQESAWAELREAQLMALSLPNTGMAVAIDIGEADDIHPKNKQEVGQRLALNALKIAYGGEIENSGPIYKSMHIEKDKIHLSFDHTSSGLMSKNSDALKGFAIAGEDKKFVWAEAKIEGDEVIVWSSKIINPVAVRYAWANNPICNLYNKADLPASPFRTDSWKGITEGNK